MSLNRIRQISTPSGPGCPHIPGPQPGKLVGFRVSTPVPSLWARRPNSATAAAASRPRMMRLRRQQSARRPWRQAGFPRSSSAPPVPMAPGRRRRRRRLQDRAAALQKASFASSDTKSTDPWSMDLAKNSCGRGKQSTGQSLPFGSQCRRGLAKYSCAQCEAAVRRWQFLQPLPGGCKSKPTADGDEGQP